MRGCKHQRSTNANATMALSYGEYFPARSFSVHRPKLELSRTCISAWVWMYNKRPPIEYLSFIYLPYSFYLPLVRINSTLNLIDRSPASRHPTSVRHYHNSKPRDRRLSNLISPEDLKAARPFDPLARANTNIPASAHFTPSTMPA